MFAASTAHSAAPAPSSVCQIHPELIDDRGLAGVARLLLRVALALVEDVDDLAANLVKRDTQRFEHAGGDTLALADQPEQQVLRPNVVMVQPPRLINGQ